MLNARQMGDATETGASLLATMFGRASSLHCHRQLQLSLTIGVWQLQPVRFHRCAVKQSVLLCARSFAIELRRNALECVPQNIVRDGHLVLRGSNSIEEP